MVERKLPLPPQWILALLVVAVFVPWWAYTAYGEHRARFAIELHTPFTRPSLELRFSKHIYYDPQTFVGRGRQAGYWEWSTNGLALTEKGGLYFRDAGDDLATTGPMGKRSITTIHSVQTRPSGLEVHFNYTWTEIAEPSSKLLNDPPKKGAEYEGMAMLTEQNGVWKVQSLNTPDLERTLAILLAQASGARR